MILEPFGGIGGFSEGLAMHGRHDSLLLDNAPQAVRIARLNGHDSYMQDITKFSPIQMPVEGIAAGPPCQGFSPAGSGAGRPDIPLILDTARAMVDSKYPHVVLQSMQDRFADRRSALVLEPWRLFLQLRPTWMALEQVPAVLPLWDYLSVLGGVVGYHAWAGKVRAEQYDVPQSRRRAVLLLHRTRADLEPIPVRSRYYERDPSRIDPDMPRWLSMADALGHGADARPAPTATGGGTSTGGAEPFGNAARQGLQREYDAGRWQLGDVRSGNGTMRDFDQPAPTLTGALDNGNTRWALRGGNQANSAIREIENPSPTLVFGGRVNEVRWLRSNYGTSGDPAARGERSDDQPAPAVTGKAGRNKWSDGGRLTARDAATLQSFRPDFELAGTLGEQYQAIGNAIPPMLAYHLFKVVL